ncbi:TetR/AcrR family transcriptional regulator [Actinomadura barringtoniae]|uniref:TetR/AcrR family transcriptional regulator n=1 Tax=Actinomadura barringtoniae TaxID=1427535 RepID=A0A939T736_9ACTN|nr:TetR/AcrR family transcriptional regulator [Actinomadura barringtoniae]MBO2445480.1 TetR/AcrR family transcriptional regulator [Actinomadura barringtoniae]
MTTRTAATAARKDQILRAAIALLAEQGYQATTFDAICRLAGLSSKRLITYHFSGKGELFAAVAAKVVEDAEAYLRPSLEAAEGAREELFAFIRANTAFIAEHLDQVRALEQIIINGDRAWDPYHLDALKRLTELFAHGQRTGAFRPFDPRVMATTLRGAMDGAYGPLAEGMDPEQCANELVQIFDRATRP